MPLEKQLGMRPCFGGSVEDVLEQMDDLTDMLAPQSPPPDPEVEKGMYSLLK